MPLVVQLYSTSDTETYIALVVCNMRGEFNLTCSVKYGPTSTWGVPGTVYLAGVPCRRVKQRRIEQGQFPFTLTTHWVTLDQTPLHQAVSTAPAVGVATTDYRRADQIAFSDQTGIWWVILRQEKVKPAGRTEYWRYELIEWALVNADTWQPPVPPPPPPPPLTIFHQIFSIDVRTVSDDVTVPLVDTNPVNGVAKTLGSVKYNRDPSAMADVVDPIGR